MCAPIQQRVVVIAASILFFRTPASFLNIIGTAVALSGVFAYSMAERFKQIPSRRPDLTAILKIQLVVREVLQHQVVVAGVG